ncbi:galactose-3-O-sulfotransferase 3-like [Dreissena polymorpha]|uniref:Uncharacterized protein n=1 Tax=Dreissena polymorpha TaxID=45954 RepID=A0A9D4E6K5_DREPO|nr:galactose-3-O-sulfotransferase 3-like [Dreissena polymorpha]KAH3774106.1 hypothetical protein DPMN_175479 [Dreissena polymorpha]
MGFRFYMKSTASFLIVIFLIYFFTRETWFLMNEVSRTRADGGVDSNDLKPLLDSLHAAFAEQGDLKDTSEDTTEFPVESSSKTESMAIVEAQKTNVSASSVLSHQLGNAQRFMKNKNITFSQSPLEKHHVVFLKVHKTGSSTVQNIFLRYGYHRKLTFVLAHDDVSLAETNFPNVISYRNSLNGKNICPPPQGQHYDILCCHVIYNKYNFSQYMPSDTVYIAIVRDPITRVESAIRYFNMYPNVNLADFALDPLKYDTTPHSMSNNRMAFEFGFPLELFPRRKIRIPDKEKRAQDYINVVINDFSLIMINERMDESVILLKRILGWSFKDVVYQKQNVAKNNNRRFTETDVANLEKHLYLDTALYVRALAEFNKKIAKAGKEFLDEVEYFKTIQNKTAEFCSRKTFGDSPLRFEKSLWDNSFEIDKSDCDLFTKFETTFIQDIRMQMYGKLKI